MKEKQHLYVTYVKRPLDIIVSLVGILLLVPLYLLVALGIKLDSKGPVLFKQQRPGKHQKVFYVYKFRTMVNHAEKDQQVGVEVTNKDQRITALGKFLRRFKIDELPQLMNILKGDMSIVGPRPTLVEYIDHYEPWELKRFEVRPGLTGLAQVNGNIYLNPKDKSAFDVDYVNNISMINDLKIIMKTVGIVIFGEDKFINKKTGQRKDR